jgi:hypothetical protein
MGLDDDEKGKGGLLVELSDEEEMEGRLLLSNASSASFFMSN